MQPQRQIYLRLKTITQDLLLEQVRQLEHTRLGTFLHTPRPDHGSLSDVIGGDQLHVAKTATSALVTSSVGDFVQLRDSGEFAEALLHMQRIPPLPGTSGFLSLLRPCVVVDGDVYQRLGAKSLCMWNRSVLH